MKRFLMVIGLIAGSAGAAAQGTVNVICSVQAERCNAVATVHARETGARINITQSGSGEALAQLIAEKESPKTDVWFGGTGAEIGSMSLIKGARNSEAAKKFYDWALTPAAQELGAQNKQFQLPSHPKVKLDPNVPDFKNIHFIDHDYAKYGSSAERRRLIARWEKEVNSLPR